MQDGRNRGSRARSADHGARRGSVRVPEARGAGVGGDGPGGAAAGEPAGGQSGRRGLPGSDAVGAEAEVQVGGGYSGDGGGLISEHQWFADPDVGVGGGAAGRRAFFRGAGVGDTGIRGGSGWVGRAGGDGEQVDVHESGDRGVRGSGAEGRGHAGDAAAGLVGWDVGETDTAEPRAEV